MDAAALKLDLIKWLSQLLWKAEFQPSFFKVDFTRSLTDSQEENSISPR